MRTDWTVIIPVKGTRDSKSRLGASAELAMAIACDTIDAVLATGSVARVIVVTSAPAARVLPVVQDASGEPTAADRGVLHNRGLSAFSGSRLTVVQDIGEGLNPAIRDVLHNMEAGAAAVAVILGDLPALVPEELSAALALAERHPLAAVPDADEEGTTLITALQAADHSPAFGAGSWAAHRAVGYVELDVPVSSGLRRDVDTEDQLLALSARLGPRSGAVLGFG